MPVILGGVVSAVAEGVDVAMGLGPGVGVAVAVAVGVGVGEGVRAPHPPKSRTTAIITANRGFICQL